MVILTGNLGLEIIRLLEEISLEHTIIACTRSGAVIKENTPQEEAAIVRRSYTQVRQVSVKPI
ncbi:hypothetical protein [Ornithinibacillus caprae]|uniref:hypothetical protein n=1 Tax=Ornithinibacillus caprae TaxID=2678566 RepID=UPI001FE8F360|nr:hypothetical protein [Ornithinibacillus caprae]